MCIVENKWDKAVVNQLENFAFYNNGVILSRRSDQYIVKRILDEFYNGLVILDYAAGTGRFAELLIKAGLKLNNNNYVGYDQSPDMIEKAKEKFPDLVFTSELKDIEARHFDILINNDMLQHSSDLTDFKEKLEQLSNIADRCFFHFWTKNQDSSEFVQICGKEINEIFPCPETITLNLLPEDLNKIVDVKFFKEKPYDTCVLEIRDVDIIRRVFKEHLIQPRELADGEMLQEATFEDLPGSQFKGKVLQIEKIGEGVCINSFLEESVESDLINVSELPIDLEETVADEQPGEEKVTESTDLEDTEETPENEYPN